MIYKKGPEEVPSSWRPIALQDCILKLFFSIIADRIIAFAVDSGIIPEWQRAFIHSDGCLECNLSLDLIRDDARATSRELCIVWMDLRNAFGSVDHSLLFDILTKNGFPSEIVHLIRQAYTDCKLLYFDGTVEKTIDEVIGLKQGCPMSPILFDLYSAPLLNALGAAGTGFTLSSGRCIPASAYADDVAVITGSLNKARVACDIFSKTPPLLNLEPNTRKCEALCVSYERSKQGVEIPGALVMDGLPIPKLHPGASVRTLGRPYGFEDHPDPEDYFKDTKLLMERVTYSSFDPWQKLRALRTYVIPAFHHLLRVGCLRDLDLSRTDMSLRLMLRHICSLPQTTSRAYFASPVSSGGLGFVPLVDLKAAFTISSVCVCLNSENKSIAQMAEHSICLATNKPTLGEAVEHIVDSRSRLSSRCKFVSRCRWSNLNLALKHLSLFINVTLRVVHNTVECWAGLFNSEMRLISDKAIFRNLSALLSEAAGIELLSLSQGSNFKLISLEKNSSYFVFWGWGMSRELWRFSMKARLNCCAIAGRHYQGQRASICERCNEPGSLFHVLSRCKRFYTLMTRRHGAILLRLARACFQGQALSPLDATRVESLLVSGSKSIIIRQGVSLLLESCVPRSRSALKPDFILYNEVLRSIYIVDVTIVGESSSRAFASARAHKLYRYRQFEPELRLRGYLVKVDALIVGTLGAWDPDNNRVLRELRCPHRGLNELVRYCSVEALRGSYEIYQKYQETILSEEASTAPLLQLDSPEIAQQPPPSLTGPSPLSPSLLIAPQIPISVQHSLPDSTPSLATPLSVIQPSITPPSAIQPSITLPPGGSCLLCCCIHFISLLSFCLYVYS